MCASLLIIITKSVTTSSFDHFTSLSQRTMELVRLHLSRPPGHLGRVRKRVRGSDSHRWLLECHQTTSGNRYPLCFHPAKDSATISPSKKKRRFINRHESSSQNGTGFPPFFWQYLASTVLSRTFIMSG